MHSIRGIFDRLRNFNPQQLSLLIVLLPLLHDSLNHILPFNLSFINFVVIEVHKKLLGFKCLWTHRSAFF